MPHLDRQLKNSMKASLVALGVLWLLLAVAGCDEGPRIMGAKREFEEQAQRARENSKERQVAHRRALRIEKAMDSNLRAARQPRTGCEVEYAPIKPRQGIVPIACGNLRAPWPLVVNHGYLRCEPSIRKNFDRVIFTAPSGTEYAVNSSAHGVGYEGIDGIWKRNGQGEKIDMDPLLARGLALCKAGT